MIEWRDEWWQRVTFLHQITELVSLLQGISLYFSFNLLVNLKKKKKEQNTHTQIKGAYLDSDLLHNIEFLQRQGMLWVIDGSDQM